MSLSQPDVRSILFVELLGGIGDVVLALPAIHALARSHPAAELTVTTFGPGAELLTHDPLVDHVVVATPGPPEHQAAQLGDLLARKRFDLVVSDTCYGAIPELLKTSGAGRAVTNLWRSPPPDQLIDRRFLQILVDEGVIDLRFAGLRPDIALDSSEVDSARAWLDVHAPGCPVVAFVPEAGMAIKEWAPERYRALALELTKRGWRVVVTTARQSARSLAITYDVPNAVVAPPRRLHQLAALLAKVELCVAPDTGPARIAAAVGTPTVCLFGPTVRERFGLGTPHRDLQSPLPCPERNPLNMTQQRCWWSGQCIFEDRRNCLDDISVEMVLKEVAALEGVGRGG